MSSAFFEDFKEADKIILITIITFSLIAAGLTSLQNGYYLLGMIGGSLVSVCAIVAYVFLKGYLVCRLVMATSLVTIMGIYVQQANGMGEGHFIFFVAVTILIRYKDMLPLMWAGVLTIIHHVTLTYCQAYDVSLLGQPIMIFSWVGTSQLGILEPLIYHLVIATIAILVSAYYIYGNIQKFIQDTTVAIATELASQGDLKARAVCKVSSPVNEFTNQFISEVQNLTTTCGELSDNLNNQSDTLVSSTGLQLQKAEEQQDMLASVAKSIEEMSSTTSDIAKNADDTARLAETTSSNSKTGTDTTRECEVSLNKLTTEIQSASLQINDLSTQGQQISGIVNTIKGIAEQTNLLALNAAIEAARAGEQGRGFAVVADEVRVLSRRTHESTEEISTMITSFKSTIEDAVKVMQACTNHAKLSVEDFNAVNTVFFDIANSVNRISELTAQIATSAEEQSYVANDVNEKTTLIHNTSQAFTQEFTSTLSEADGLKKQAASISELISKYR
ncbi:MAG: methyl-accepting chemotaxis protein [Pseudomonadota bacterium]